VPLHPGDVGGQAGPPHRAPQAHDPPVASDFRTETGSTCDARFAASRTVTQYTDDWPRRAAGWSPGPASVPNETGHVRTAYTATPVVDVDNDLRRLVIDPFAPTSGAAGLGPAGRRAVFSAAEQAVTIDCPRCGSAGARQWRRKVACGSCGLLWTEYRQPQALPRLGRNGTSGDEQRTTETE
jgi:hypothetical protein